MGPQNDKSTVSSSEEHLNLTYQHGFGNTFRSESVPDSLPKLGHNPQKVPYGLYTEGITGSAFTAPRNKNRRSWFYRIRPSVVHFPYEPYTKNPFMLSDFHKNSPDIVMTPAQLRWDPFTVKGANDLDFVDSIRTIGGAGNPQHKDGIAMHFYQFGKDMVNKAMYSSDGDMLFMPAKGELLITTEFGKMHVPPNHIAVVQRMMKFTVTRVGDHSAGEPAEGYVIEVFKGHYELPELGPIGGNGLANIEDFQTPNASYQDTDDDWNVIVKYGGDLFQYKLDHSPYDVVAWMGNYVPFKYDLGKFNAMGSITFDHPDPSLSTVLTVPTDTPGTAVVDIAAFGPRWSAVHDTFRPAWFHRNIMSEFMVTLGGMPSPRDGANLHNLGQAHGPSKDVTDAAHSNAAPTGAIRVLEGAMIILIETYLPINPTKWAMETNRQPEYLKEMWQNITRHHSLPPASQ